LPLAWVPPAAQAQSLEELVEDALQRQQGISASPAAEPSAAPAATDAPAGGLQPVELGPKPYTPPILSRPAEDVPHGPESQSQPTNGETPPQTAESPAGEPKRALESLTPEEVNAAPYSENAEAMAGASPLILKAQVLLDRAGASPGVIDSFYGENVAKAIEAVETVVGLPVDGRLDKDVWEALRGDQSGDVLVAYEITAQDLDYPFLPRIPSDYAEQAELPALGYTSPEEMLGERFHMDVDLLLALNPQADFRRPGAKIWVAAVEGQKVEGKISRIVADKGQRQVRAYDASDRLIVAYPATIGSPDNPSPTGEHRVEGVATDPVYYYDPKNIVQGDNTEELELPPGPNNPVGTVWIDLSEPSYGIHGTPEPDKIDKTGSHGCVRLTNWDAEELAGLVEPGVLVSFVE
jgi:lipoprotein-anchoring transpeptidase ErfK/SrfK